MKYYAASNIKQVIKTDLEQSPQNKNYWDYILLYLSQ